MPALIVLNFGAVTSVNPRLHGRLGLKSRRAGTIIPGMMRDVRKIGHFGTGDLEVTLRTMADFEQVQPLIITSYEAS